jgi:hypothetical protein
MVLQPSAIELKRRHRRKARRAELDAIGDVAVAVVREEVAKAELLELIGAKMRFEAEALLEIVGADLDARLADLERRLRDRMCVLLDDQHAQARRLLVQLAREAAAGQPASENHNVVVGPCLQLVHAAAILAEAAGLPPRAPRRAPGPPGHAVQRVRVRVNGSRAG